MLRHLRQYLGQRYFTTKTMGQDHAKPISPLYAGIFAIFALVLSFRAGSHRGKAGVSILNGEPVDWELAQRVRVHQNFLEYVPIVLIMMALEAPRLSPS